MRRRGLLPHRSCHAPTSIPPQGATYLPHTAACLRRSAGRHGVSYRCRNVRKQEWLPPRVSPLSSLRRIRCTNLPIHACSRLCVERRGACRAGVCPLCNAVHGGGQACRLSQEHVAVVCNGFLFPFLLLFYSGIRRGRTREI